MNADTAKTTKKRSRFIIVAIAVCILLLAGVGLQWGKSSSAPTSDVLIRSSFSHVSYMTPEDAEYTRKLLDNRERYQHWPASIISYGDGGWDYQIYYNHQIFGVNLENDRRELVMYSTVDSDGKIHYVTSYYFNLVGDRGSDDLAFFRELEQKYCGNGGNSATIGEAFTPAIPDTLVLGTAYSYNSGIYPMNEEDAEAFKRLLDKKWVRNPLHPAEYLYPEFCVCIGDRMYCFSKIINDDGSYISPYHHPMIFDAYSIGTDGIEYLTTYETDEESMKEMWAMMNKYVKLNSGLT